MTDNPEPNKQLPPTVLTIFGVTGNLAQIKLIPALYHLMKANMLPEKFTVVGVFRETSMDPDHLMQLIEINLLRKHQDADPAILQRLRDIFHPIVMDSTNKADYDRLRQLLDQLDNDHGLQYQRLFYLAIPPDIFPTVINCLHDSGLNDESAGQARRILVEKPFGTNLETARSLVDTIKTSFDEHQIYRIDHYLAKENAQNILTFRFNNPIMEDIWGRQFIDHIQITASETIGIESRSNFYEGMGALRDFVQSHLLQLMTLIMMESPTALTSEAIHAEKIALLNSVEPIKQNHVEEQAVRGQYQGYRDEAGNPNSNIETYAALSLEVANSRWGGVPILIRTGKALAEQQTGIKIIFKDRSRRNVPPNVLTIRIQPNEGISFRLTAKKPGFSDVLQPVDMDFNYKDSFDSDSPDAYERVIVDAIAGDQSLFASSEEVLRCWEILEPVLEYWQYNTSQPTVYEKGGWGPPEADALAQSFGSNWL
jgi:glucose-6-phosphate 1-dehydrogenase